MSAAQPVVLLGAKGQLGQALSARLEGQLEGVGPVVALDRSHLDLTNLGAIAPTLAALNPRVIINAAAYTAVDRAEAEPELAQVINAEVPGRLAQVAAEVGARLIHVSTDYVFPGTQGRPWGVDDAPAPLGVYGRTKAAGEAAVRSALPQGHWIVRTAWVYGATGGNFVKTMLRLAHSRPQVRVVQDQVGTPTWTEDLAGAIAALLPLGNTAPPGTYHYTNSGVASWYDFAVAIFEEAAALGLCPSPEVIPIPSQDYPTPAPRPLYSVLDCAAFTALLGQPAPHWRTSLRAMLCQLPVPYPAPTL